MVNIGSVDQLLELESHMITLMLNSHTVQVGTTLVHQITPPMVLVSILCRHLIHHGTHHYSVITVDIDTTFMQSGQVGRCPISLDYDTSSNAASYTG